MLMSVWEYSGPGQISIIMNCHLKFYPIFNFLSTPARMLGWNFDTHL
jgi:hypothetical protein